MSNIIKLVNLDKTFETFKRIKVLKKVSYSFKKGKIYSLVGPSGSGKSTLLNLLSLIGHYGTDVQNKANMMIEKELINFVGTDCHNMGHATIYEKCQTIKAWHHLVESGKLLNHTL